MELVDADVLIDVLRGHPPAVAWFRGLQTYPGVPGYVLMELVQSAKNAAAVRRSRKLVAPCPVVWATEAESDTALANYSTLHLSHGLGLIDALTAACAVGRSATLLTFNTKHYRAVPNLRIAKPYIR